jgi:hypothetical protein
MEIELINGSWDKSHAKLSFELVDLYMRF